MSPVLEALLWFGIGATTVAVAGVVAFCAWLGRADWWL